MIDLSPDTVTVAITRSDGGVTVMKVIVSEYQEHTREDGTKEKIRTIHHEITDEYIQSLIDKRGNAWNAVNGKKAVSWRIVPDDYGVEDRTYRNAWMDVPDRVKPDHDMVKARNIHRDILRKARQPRLDTLDVDYMVALETSNRQTQTTISAQKQKLRDVPADPRIEAAKTIDELKLLTLEELTK